MRLPAAALAVSAVLTGTGAVESAFRTEVNGSSRFAAAPTFAPRLISPPTIEATAREGETLTATAGEWARGPRSLRIEWLRCDDACTVIGEGTTRELTADDVGKRFEVRVTATNDGGSAAATSERTQTVTAMTPPKNESLPAVTGTPTIGETLTATDGSWSGDRLTHTRTWLRCFGTTCLTIPGETEDRYLLTGNDAGLTIRVAVRASNARGSVVASSPVTSPVARQTYTQLLCADPATGTGVGTDGALPDGLSTTGTLTSRFDPHAGTRCAPTAASPHVPLSTGGTYSTTTPDDRIVLEYRTPASVEFRGATLYRYGTMSGRWSWAISTATSTHLFASPRAELCSWGDGCTTRGTTSDRFATQNRVDVNPGTTNGFNVSLACDIAAGSRCDANGTQIVRLYGGRVTLRDTATPVVTAKGGGLLDGPLQPVEDLDVTATDAGSGLWRLRVTIDGQQVATRALHDNQGRCTHGAEFVHRQPCVLSVATSLAFDTASWPKSGRLRIYLEDAGRNTTTVANRLLA
jgi:hypothetical protein